MRSGRSSTSASSSTSTARPRPTRRTPRSSTASSPTPRGRLPRSGRWPAPTATSPPPRPMSSIDAASTSRPRATRRPPDARGPAFADLRRELPWSSARAWRFAAARAGTRAGALLSDGLRIGFAHGFDSGAFMAHAYADDARGRTALGRRLDRRLLDRPTLVAFREIRALAEQAVLDAIGAAGTDAPVVADLAAGPAPYVLAGLAAHPGARAILRDVDDDALAEARRAAAARGLADRVTTARADAFDRDALAALQPRPD